MAPCWGLAFLLFGIVGFVGILFKIIEECTKAFSCGVFEFVLRWRVVLGARVHVARFWPKSMWYVTACGNIPTWVRAGGTAILDGGTGGLREGGMIRVAGGDIITTAGAGSSLALLLVDAILLRRWWCGSQNVAADEALLP